VTYAGGFLFWGKTYFNEPSSPPGAGGAAVAIGAYAFALRALDQK